MTEEKWEKVIKGLECCAIDGGCGACPYDSFKDCPGYQPTPETLMKDALALLKAQEPKLVHVTANINHRKIGECPTCGKYINSRDYPNYCGRCGQAVKWE